MTMTFYLLHFEITYLITDVIRYCIVCKHGFQWQR